MQFDGLIADGAQHVDHHPPSTRPSAAPAASSEASRGQTTSVFNGKVFVRPDAQQTDAQQMNQISFSRRRPDRHQAAARDLADDVKQPRRDHRPADEDAIFYLRARGVDEAGARRLLIYGFANELIERVEVDRCASARGRPGRTTPAARSPPARRYDRRARRQRPPRDSPPPPRVGCADFPVSTSRCTASRSSTSTTPPRRRSRAR
jgi:Fe-S cluster assembly protein SufD